jgi:hypothetical protein
MRNAYNLLGEPEEKRAFVEYGGRVWIGFIWLGIWSGDMFSGTSGSYERRKIS